MKITILDFDQLAIKVPVSNNSVNIKSVNGFHQSNLKQFRPYNVVPI